MLTLYPAIKAYAEHNLKVDELHTLYVEESGDPDGIPIVYIHGGPGSCCEPDHRRFFDPKRYRIILFDQRGCGRSTPYRCLIDNTTQDLVQDLEKIRKFLGVQQWILFGGSWGATLALLYAQQYPANVRAMVLRGTFLARQCDLDWLYKEGGASKIFPDHWQQFVSYVPAEQRDNLIQGYCDQFNSEDELLHMGAAKSWSLWESECFTLEFSPDNEKKFTSPHIALSLAAIETHYFVNQCFIKENQILLNMPKIAHIPAIIVHGRYDMVCTLDNSFALAQVWPAAQLEIIRHAGHSSREPAITCALVQATNELVGDYLS